MEDRSVNVISPCVRESGKRQIIKTERGTDCGLGTIQVSSLGTHPTSCPQRSLTAPFPPVRPTLFFTPTCVPDPYRHPPVDVAAVQHIAPALIPRPKAGPAAADRQQPAEGGLTRASGKDLRGCRSEGGSRFLGSQGGAAPD